MYRRNVSETLKKQVAASQQWKCARCGNLLSAFFEVDHILALWRGGSNDKSNLQALDRECHALKGAEERELEARLSPAEKSRGRFDALFQHSRTGAFPLEVAQKLSRDQFGHSFEESHVVREPSPSMVFPPHWQRMFQEVGLPPRQEGKVLQGVRLKESRRSVK
jgi:hypothetical protein